MLWMGIWVHPYTVTPVQFRGGFSENWGRAEPKHVAMSWWLRLQTPMDCIPHPYCMYTKCFSTLICCGWAYGYTLTLLRRCRSGVDLWKIGAGLSPSDVVMSWLMLQTPVDCIPHPYHVYKQCFSTLICCEWAYGSTLTLLHLCWSGVNFRKIGVGLSPSVVVMSWLRLQTPIDCIPHPYHMYTKCFSTLICLRLCRSGWILGKLV